MPLLVRSGHDISVVDISVVLCTYNGAEFIREQLDTILAQTLRPLELIVSDDGSSDATLTIVEDMVGRATAAGVPIRVHRNARQLGFADNFLSACTRARGTHIAFSDQDDIWAPEKLETSARALVDYAAALCVHDVEPVARDGVSPVPERVDRTTRSLLGPSRRPGVVESLQDPPWSKFYGFTMLFDRRLLDHIPADERGADPHAPGSPLSHDRWICFLASVYGRTVVLADRLARYRQHDGQIYGGDVRRGLVERLRTKAASGAAQAHYLADLAGYRAALLESVGPAAPLHTSTSRDARVEAHRQAGARHWRRVAAHQGARARLYDEASPLVRSRIVVANLRHGVYRSPHRGGLGPRRLAEDVVVATALRPSPPADSPSKARPAVARTAG